MRKTIQKVALEISILFDSTEFSTHKLTTKGLQRQKAMLFSEAVF